MHVSLYLPQQLLAIVTSKKHSSDDRALLKLHRTLIEADSTSQLSELSAAKVLVKHFKSIGWHYQLLPCRGNNQRPNVLAWPGKTNETKLLVTSHIDTVPPYIPYSKHGKSIWGRGSSDAKASVATQIIAVQRLLEKKMIHADDVALLYVVGEETAGDGMRAFSELAVTEGKVYPNIVFGEPTENKIAIGHKGMVLFNVTASGKAAHSGYPELGSSANEKLIDLLYDLKHHTFPSDETLGNTTFNIGVIQGGSAANVIPAHGSAHCAFRVAKDLDGILTYLRDAVATSPDMSFDIEQAAPPSILDSLEGTEFEEIVVNYSTDVPNLSREVATGKRFLFGPGSILVAHGDDEHIEIDKLLGTAHDYELIFNKILSAA
ncbi:putative peptidase [Protomyces lactucae-debilis]|uniref:Putative peptidase n=1 Tax=Protomyces lactucae-debilis TaxID=2754530 RepID=A0A1Y2FMA1_PROLT|nr:putative peptidase [Protomyces lactucae-debilis]ORY85103.1 putative peptidase [Protomyces lactucae-debilis]